MGEPFPGLGPKVSGPVDGQAPLHLPLIPWMGAHLGAFGSPARAWARLCSRPLVLTCVDGGQSEVGGVAVAILSGESRWFESTCSS